MAARVWSVQQLALFDRFRNAQSGHLLVRARAGCAKTTSIIEGVNVAPEQRILLAAFNKRIAEELQGRITNPNATAKTLHGVGFGIVRRFWENVTVCRGGNRAAGILSRADGLTERVCGGATPDAIKRLVSKLHSFGREIAPHASQLGDLTALAFAFDLAPDEVWEESGYDLQFVETHALRAMALAAEAKPANGIDFSDMIFLPIRNKWLTKQYDLVVVDEAQDMTPAQLEIARGVCRGRVVVVGDDRQAIYGFRGADSGSLDRLKAELQAEELPLTVTYRCGRSIVAEAARIVPDFTAADTVQAGEVVAMAKDKLVASAQPGDFVLSRKNAALVGVALSLVRANKRVRIAGRDIGAGLKAIVTKLAKGAARESVPALLERLTVWLAKETDRATKAGRDERVELLRDQFETLTALCDGVASVREIEARVDVLFTDNGLGDAGVVTCSSVHRSKGLEADRVFVLRDTLYPKRKTPATPAQQLEESNIEYVAITRARNVLVWVHEVGAIAATTGGAL